MPTNSKDCELAEQIDVCQWCSSVCRFEDQLYSDRIIIEEGTVVINVRNLNILQTLIELRKWNVYVYKENLQSFGYEFGKDQENCWALHWLRNFSRGKAK